MTPVLHVLAGPNGAGKSTFVERVVKPATRLPFINADEIAAERWRDPEGHAYEAARLAADRRRDLLSLGRSFITETVFSHPSKTSLIAEAVDLGYHVTMHVIMVPLALARARVEDRVARGGHSVPPQKIGDRYSRLWGHVADARHIASRTLIYDNSTIKNRFRTVAEYDRGMLAWHANWPPWSPLPL